MQGKETDIRKGKLQQLTLFLKMKTAPLVTAALKKEEGTSVLKGTLEDSGTVLSQETLAAI